MKARILFYLAAAAALVLVALPVGVVVGGAVVYVPDDYPTIQQAVDNAAAGDTIVVRDGTYQENVAVNKALTIQSENGTANCVVSAANPDEHVFEVSADGVSITGLMVENAAGVNSAGKEAAGVYLGAAEHCTISGNDVTGNNLGIWLEDSCSNTLTDNNVHDNVYGIVVDSFSNNNVLMNNAATNNGDSGFVVASSSGNTFTNNTATDNSNYGIYLVDSSNNNTLYNNYFNNTNNAYDDGTNTWNTARTEGANIIGGPYLGGNCWSDYAGADTNGDGLGDTLVPYAEGIPHCGDYLPLTTSSVCNLNTGEGFSTIQAAVDDPDTQDGDTIMVGAGTYHENVVVNKQLTIESTSGDPADTIVSAANPDEHVFEVSADGVSITGLTVENAAGKEAAGVHLNAAGHCSITNNSLTNNYFGICLHSSSNSMLTGNSVWNNTVAGIVLNGAYENILTNNEVDNNPFGIYVYCSSNNNITGNSVWNNTGAGIYLNDAYESILTNNEVDNNPFGIYLYCSSNNNITGNTVVNSADYGIYLVDSSNNNTLYNNYFNNTNNAYDDGTNTWNTARTEGANIIGGPYLGGNCWSDYAGADTNGDGLGDTLVPYAEGIPHCGDYLPLVLPAVTPAGAGSAGVPTAGITYKAGTGSADATIAGTTYEANANLMAGASIVLELDGEAVASTTSDANGGYSFTVGGVGNYTVTVTKDGFTSQSKWVDVTALEQGYTVYFKGMDASYPTAPSGSYVTKCSNLWLCGASYSQGFALEASRVFDVLYAWVHPS